MQLTFLGGVEEVGRLGCVVEIGGAVLCLDYGMAPTRPPTFPQHPPALDGLLLTHSHLDHSGLVAYAVAERGCPVWCTDATIDVAEILAFDSLKIAKAEGHELPFNLGEVQEMIGAQMSIRTNRWFSIEGAGIRAHRAGHIPGAVSYELEDGNSTMVFSGDIGGQPMRLVKPPRLPACDTLVLEATYSGRDHPPRPKLEQAFLDKVEEVVSNGGRAVVPAFAVGRTQEMLLLLAETDLPVWVDGMGRRVSRLFTQHPYQLRSVNELKRALDQAHFVHNFHMRNKAADRPGVIVTTSGMLDGGPVLSYLKRLHRDPRTEILLTGYQVAGTNGRRLLDTGRILIDEAEVKVECPVSHFDFSAHAGHSELVEQAKRCQPTRVVLYHSEDRQPLATALEEEGFEVLLPRTGETFRI